MQETLFITREFIAGIHRTIQGKGEGNDLIFSNQDSIRI